MSFDILCVGWNKNEESEWYVVPRKIVNLNNIYTGRMIMMEYYHEKIVEIDLKSLYFISMYLLRNHEFSDHQQVSQN